MTTELKKAANDLAADTKEIIKNFSLTDAEKSREIMGRICKEYISLRNSYINSFKTSSNVTVNPESPDVKYILEEGDREGEGLDEFTRIYAYSFGPYRPAYYFDKNMLRIVWLLKEPYLCDMVQMRGRVEGYAQDQQYNIPAEINKNNTHHNIIIVTQNLLLYLAKVPCEELLKIKDETLRRQIEHLKYENLDDENVIMNHICILEMNHFPGLNLNGQWKSNGTFIENWADINSSSLSTLFDFYQPSLTFCWLENAGFCSYSGLFNVVAERGDRIHLKKESTLFLREWEGGISATIMERNIERSWYNRENLPSKGASAILDEKGCLWIAYYHPFKDPRKDYWNKEYVNNLSNWIIEVLLD